MADVLPFKPKEPEKPREPLFWGHECRNYLFKLRDDGRIECDKCGHVFGGWSLNGYDYPEKPF